MSSWESSRGASALCLIPASLALNDGGERSGPTGSTAYNLAAGGPVISPEVDALVVTPICPHSLSQRPIILPGRDVVAVRLAEGEKRTTDIQVTLDGQIRRARFSRFPPGCRAAT